MPSLDDPEVVATDVLVIGGGAAACSAALEAAKHGVQVTILDKGRVGRSGSSATSGGGTAALVEEECQRIHKADTLAAGLGINDEALVEILVKEGISRVADFETLGVAYSKDVYRRPISGHSQLNTSRRITGGSASMMEVLRKEVLHRGVQVFEGVMAAGLFVRDGRVIGVLALDIRRERTCVFEAKSVVLAAGSATGLYTYASPAFVTTGDAFALGYHAGAELANLEFIEFTLNPAPHGHLLAASGVNPFVSHGARFVNARGEAFMAHHAAEKADSAARGQLVLAAYREMIEGRGPVFSDQSEISPEGWRAFEATSGANVLPKLRALGVDPRRERFEWVPAVHTHLGGLIISQWAETRLAGLYAAGESSTGVHGAERLGGNAMSECLVFGHRAGRSSAVHALATRRIPPSAVERQAEIDRLRAHFGNTTGDVRQLQRQLKALAWETLGVVRTEAGLRRGEGEFQRVSHEMAPLLRVGTIADLARVLEVENLALIGEMVSGAALLRRESRGCHQRQDYPQRDDENWRRCSVLRKGPDGTMQTSLRTPGTGGSPVPTEWH